MLREFEIKNKSVSELESKSKSKISTAEGGYREEEYIKEYMNSSTTLQEIFSKFFETETKYDLLSRITGTHKVDISDGKECNIQVKKSKLNQFGQVARHWTDYIVTHIPDLSGIQHLLKRWVEIPLLECGKLIDTTSKRVKLTTEFFTEEELSSIISSLNEWNVKKSIIELALLGTSKELQPNYMCVVLYENDIRKKIIFYKMIDIIKYLLNCDFYIAKKRTVIYLGDFFSIQRKGGDGGKKSSNQLQIKIIPSKLEIISTSLVIDL